MAAAAELSEPRVLAATKAELFSTDVDDGYVVTDTQFGQERWLGDRPIDRDVQSVLAPFNHVRIGSGYPDLVAVAHLDDDVLTVDRLADRHDSSEQPLIAIEAKGYTRSGTVDVAGGIVQAYDRLHEANVAFVCGPQEAITGEDRMLARELNVGLLGVRLDGSTAVLERPRVVGNRTTDEATALRFQASSQGVASKSFGLNHPKNYLAVPLAVYHDDDTEALVHEHVVGAVDSALRGAVFLGLVAERAHGLRLTSLGEEVVRYALRTRGSIESAIGEFERWQRTRQRFVEEAPGWGEVTRRVVYDYPATELLVTELQQMHDDGVESPSLVELVRWMHRHHPTFTIELFIRGDEGVRERVLTDDGDLRDGSLQAGERYHSPTVFQLKAMLYHAGILTERGSEPSNLDPTTDVWELREPLSPWR